MPQPRRPLVAGNWKMNGMTADLAEIAAVAAAVVQTRYAAEIVLCPPATLLMAAAARTSESPLALGGQDCHQSACGAHTGDLAAAMLKDAGAAYVILGHSERRAEHGESDALVAAKTAAAWRVGLSVILCVGETEAERAKGDAMAKVGAELAASLPQPPDDLARLAIAYEPVWAIGSGVTPGPNEVTAMHGFLRATLMRQFGETAAAVRILYGGSVKPTNAAALLTAPDVDGALVGGASLKAADFLAIADVFRQG